MAGTPQNLAFDETQFRVGLRLGHPDRSQIEVTQRFLAAAQVPAPQLDITPLTRRGPMYGVRGSRKPPQQVK